MGFAAILQPARLSASKLRQSGRKAKKEHRPEFCRNHYGDSALQALGKDGRHPSLVKLMGVYHNLVRLWSDT